MSEDQVSYGAMRDKIQEAISWTRMEQYEDAITVFEDFLSVLSSEGDLQDKRFAASAFSYYGLCVAMVRHKYAEAVKYCNLSVKANFMDPEHRINLALVYLERPQERSKEPRSRAPPATVEQTDQQDLQGDRSPQGAHVHFSLAQKPAQRVDRQNARTQGRQLACIFHQFSVAA